MNGRSVTVVSKQDPLFFQQLLKVGNIMNGLYGLQQTFSKLSLLALYHRIFWVKPAFCKSAWAVGTVQSTWGIVVLLAHVFACRPVAKVWSPRLPGYCINTNIFFSIYESVNSLLDFVVAGLAIWMLPSLQLRRSTLWRLGLLFIVGSLYVTNGSSYAATPPWRN